ncbi:hypothetical protein MAR_014051 [Mya arenaria]|uniref:Uncharacterized protein n=1 Tax=Mya arenaria TaxID=6604 RepID=A0ABY7G4U5_MYAAR|nr:hypothetical protein MAR_014051 [Mya arenaria]
MAPIVRHQYQRVEVPHHTTQNRDLTEFQTTICHKG